MSYTELQQQFYELFPVYVYYFLFFLIGLVLVGNILSNKRVVRVLCRFILLIPVLLVSVILHLTKYNS